MAFRILDNEEISLLDENQRKQYENELEIYLLRVAFVERLDELENATIPSYEPKLESILVINGIEVKPFTRQEYILSACEPIVKPDLQVNPFEMAEPIVPVLPMLSKRPEVYVEHISKVEGILPELPSISKPAAPDKHFEKAEIKHPDLPAVAKLSIAVKSYKHSGEIRPDLPTVIKPAAQTDFFFKSVCIDYSDIKESIPDVFMPRIELNPFVMLEKTWHSLPEVSVHFADVRDYRKPEQTEVVLPRVAEPNINTNYFKKVEPIKTNLPQLNDIAQVKVTFRKPEQSNAKLPTVVKPSVNVQSFKKTELTGLCLPETKKISIQPKDFSKPELPVPALPSIAKLNSEIKSFERPEYKNPDLPIVAKMGVVTKTFKQLEITQFHIVASSCPTVNVNPFAKIESKADGLPGRIVVNIPDAYEKLRQLFPTMNGESGVLEGTDL
ncbi:hypothetical protein CLHUN_40820 [Ruminiclostridium hungatei]|uniref:Uncharacterized protein n=1 Tax=Ruminiclostridium hungatei TaxID=48256 RepID=A0A1V4SE55_RUMHU|nr:hypothetical protein [Ruminiclostridium hungatei]OPX42023.1 hypothetical protein CLHUN_40820 [Ruminiclostridium hungatei]